MEFYKLRFAGTQRGLVVLPVSCAVKAFSITHLCYEVTPLGSMLKNTPGAEVCCAKLLIVVMTVTLCRTSPPQNSGRWRDGSQLGRNIDL